MLLKVKKSPLKIELKVQFYHQGGLFNREPEIEIELLSPIQAEATPFVHLCVPLLKSNESWQVAAASPARINSPERKFEAMKILKFGFFSS